MAGTPRPALEPGAMRRFGALLALLVGGIGVGGCSIAGSWRTVAVDPPGLPFPLDRMSFDESRNYTATWSYEGEKRTSTGQYRWNGFRLDVLQPGSQPRSYHVRRRLDGKLVLTLGEGDRKVSTILERETSPAPGGPPSH